MDRNDFLKKLGKMLWDNIDGSIDTDHPTCPQCGNKMKFYGHSGKGKNILDFPIGEGYWECKNCNFKCTENEVHLYMGDE